jgi:hypothetical protein
MLAIGKAPVTKSPRRSRAGLDRSSVDEAPRTRDIQVHGRVSRSPMPVRLPLAATGASLAPATIAITVKAVRVCVRNIVANPEGFPIAGDVAAVQVRWGRSDAEIRVRWVTALCDRALGRDGKHQTHSESSGREDSHDCR